MPIALAIGPFTITIGPQNMVVASTPCMLKGSESAASTAAITTGMYSGAQPAMTALMATFSTVIGCRSGGSRPRTSLGSRFVPLSMRCTRSRVGGTVGSPSDQPREYIASNSSSCSPTSTRRAWNGTSPYLISSSSTMPG